jgi:hypothetical protein
VVLAQQQKAVLVDDPDPKVVKPAMSSYDISWEFRTGRKVDCCLKPESPGLITSRQKAAPHLQLE